MVNKEEKIKKKKKIIVDALKRRLEYDVYSKITVQDIADEADFSKGGVLHYFQTKEDIYLDLIEIIFNEIESIHASILDWNYESNLMVSISALVGVENFILDKKNIKIIINLLLYAFEDDKIMSIMQKFIRRHRLFYENIINNVDKKKNISEESEKGSLDPGIGKVNLSRMIQVIVLFSGLLESVDPIGIDHIEIVKFVTKLMKE